MGRTSLPALLSALLTALACGGGEAEPTPPPPTEPQDTGAPEGTLELIASMAIDVRREGAWSAWDLKPPTPPHAEQRLHLYALWPDEAWLYAVVSTQDALYQRIARRAPGESDRNLVPEGFELGREGQPWKLLQVIASADPLPAFEAMSGPVQCTYLTQGDPFSEDPCTALEGIRSVGKPRVRNPKANKGRTTTHTRNFGDQERTARTMRHRRERAVAVDFLLPKPK